MLKHVSKSGHRNVIIYDIIRKLKCLVCLENANYHVKN